MEIFKVAKASLLSKYDKADSKIQRISKTIGAIVVILSATTGACSWATAQFQSAISTQISELREEIQANNKKEEQQITRLELANLIHNQPNNKAEIEKVARYYFVILGGDWYMTGLYSQWADEHGGDISFIVSKE